MKHLFTLLLFCISLPQAFARNTGQTSDTLRASRCFISVEGGAWNNTVSSLRNLKTILPQSWVYSPSAEIYFGKNITPHVQLAVGLSYASTSVSYRDTTPPAPNQSYYSAVTEIYSRRNFIGTGLKLNLHKDIGAFRIGIALNASAGVNGKMKQQCVLQRTFYYSNVSGHSQVYTESKTGAFSFASFTGLSTQAGYNFGPFTVYATAGAALWMARPSEEVNSGTVKTQLDPSYRIGIEYRL